MTAITYSTPRGTTRTHLDYADVRAIDPRLSYGPEPRAVTLLECSDGYVIVLSYGRVASVLAVALRRCRGTLPRVEVARDAIAVLGQVGVLVAPLPAVWAALGYKVAEAAELPGGVTIFRNRHHGA